MAHPQYAFLKITLLADFDASFGFIYISKLKFYSDLF